MGLRDEAAVDFQTVGTGEECGCRLVVADLRMKRVAIGDWDVRRVGDYRIEGRAGWQCVEQIGFEETDAAGEAVARGVGDGYLERGGGDVDGGDLCMGKMVGERYGDGARTGADVENFERCFVIQFAEDGFDQVFRVGAGDEDGRCDAEREAVELLLAGNVLDGFAGEAAGDCGCVGSLFGGGEGAVGVGVVGGAGQPRDVEQEGESVAVGVVAEIFTSVELRGGAGEGFAKRLGSGRQGSSRSGFGAESPRSMTAPGRAVIEHGAPGLFGRLETDDISVRIGDGDHVDARGFSAGAGCAR